MGDVTYGGTKASWGPAETAAMDRCLSVPGLSARAKASRASPQLSRTIETEIIPRLLLAHLQEPDAVPASTRPALDPAEIEAFATTVLEHDPARMMGHVESLRIAGHSLHALFLDLLAPTARRLGEMWEEDRCSFTDVTIGLSRLQQVLRELAPAFENEARPEIRGRILLAASPGEQHAFGLSMLETFFRRAGWDVCGGPSHSPPELLRFAREEWLDVIGLSLSSDVLYGQAQELLRSLKKASRNPSTVVIVGGRYFTDHPDHAADVGADTMAYDAPDALRQADACLRIKLARC